MAQEVADPLTHVIPEQELNRVFNQPEVDIDPYFLGFTEIYRNLSEIIPKHWTIIDLGCAFNPQCYYFAKHKKYIAVDLGKSEKFKTDNCTIFEMDIDKFISNHLLDLDLNLNETFAICSYVPTSTELIRKTFKNLFVYYPSHTKDPFYQIVAKRMGELNVGQ